MKHKRKIITVLSLICLSVMLVHTASVAAAALIPKKEQSSYASAVTQQNENRQTMTVCTSVLSIYGNPSLSGTPVAQREKGDSLTVSTSDGLIYSVYTTAGLLGYCHASGLIYADTKTVAKVPFVWETYTYELPAKDEETPDESVDGGASGGTADGTDSDTDNSASGTDGTQSANTLTDTDTGTGNTDTDIGTDNGGTDTDTGTDSDTDLPADDSQTPPPPTVITVTKYSDLVDVNEFAYGKNSLFAVSSKTVLVQRDLLKCLEIECHALKGLGVSVSVENGYSVTPYSNPALEGCPVSSRSGALVKLSLKDGAGASISPSDDTQVLELLTNAGLVRVGESDWFYLSSYENYLTVSISSSSLVYTIYE